MKGKIKERKGITLIALVITIIVLLILAGVSIATLTGDSGILTQSKKSKISTELSSYKEQVELYKQGKYIENNNFLAESLTAGKENLFYNTQPSGEEGNIKTIIENISDEYLEKIEIIKGELLINTKDKDEVKIAQSLGIEVNPYDIVEGVLTSSNGNLLLMDENGTVTVPDSVTEIGEGAFANLNGLKTIIIPGTVKRIGSSAFAYNATLENVIMQEGVEEIGNNAFQSCSNLKNVDLPSSLISIGVQAFLYCHSLQKVEIPSKIKTIESDSFYDCSKLNKVILNEGLEKIESNAFANTSFSKIEIPSTVVNIGSLVFANNKNLDNIVIKGNCPYVYESGMLMTKAKDNILFVSDSYLKSVTTFTIPEGIIKFNVSINSYNNIKKLIIPSTLQSISNANALPTTISDIEISGNNSKYAVSNENKILYTKDTKELISCFSKEETIDLKDIEGISILAQYSFNQAENAKTIILPDLLTTINAFSFTNCGNIQEIKIGSNVSYIHPLFKYVNYIGKVTIDSSNNSYIIENNILYSKDKKTLVCVLYAINGKFEIDESVEKIETHAFHNQGQMTEVVIPDSVKKIKKSFNYCGRINKHRNTKFSRNYRRVVFFKLSKFK